MIQLRELTPQERRIYGAPDNSALGTEVRKARKASGLSVARAARRAQVHPTTWWSIERGDGNPRLSTLLAVGRSLNSPEKA